ncbi:MAG TPA: HAD-IA family hydrolase [Candidatus Acidoferrum sp.]|jgi:sugar-phosphatase|nr:HAD-IA family hydrolase [Candidatus Acidoferrum sp.]
MPRIVCRGLLIDMDGVLVDSTAAIARVWARWAARYNMDPVYVTAFAHGRTSRASIKDLLPNDSPELHDEEDRWMLRAEIEDVADVVALPGARELLAAVPSAQRVVVTSAARNLAEVRLRAAGLWDFIRHLVTSSDIQNGKPHPEPYLKGAAALQLPPADCVVIEDAASGTRAGKSASARVLAIRTTSTDDELLAAGADWMANDCASLRCTLTPGSDQLIIEFPANEIPRLPKMS